MKMRAKHLDYEQLVHHYKEEILKDHKRIEQIEMKFEQSHMIEVQNKRNQYLKRAE